MKETVLVLDFGGQYKELIARAVRELNVYSVIKPCDVTISEINQVNPIGIILTGGPKSAYLNDSPKCDPKIFTLGIPVLGICYGMHIICRLLGGEVKPAKRGEYGTVNFIHNNESVLFNGISTQNNVLMSHGDYVSKLPKGFVNTGKTLGCENAAFENSEKMLYGVQFHPETKQTINGKRVIQNFLFDVCKAAGNYKLDDYIESQIKLIKNKAGKQKVLLALSGGVDSSVCAALLSKAINTQLYCIFVDHGLMREDEGDEIERIFKKRALNFIRVDAKKRFLSKLKGVTDPEKKRKVIGEEFIRVFEEEAIKLGDIPFLAQGTIYPDVIESGGEKNAVIKSHHNVGGLPENFNFKEIIEPLSELFKDEVRIIGKKLGLPAKLINRQPFPGPGLAVRVMGEVTEEKLNVLRLADKILREEVAVIKNKPQQYFAVYTNVNSVGVKGDDRVYGAVIAIRAVTTDDFMTCKYTPLPHNVLQRVSSRITNEIQSVSRVVYDITDKPPATVEWE